MTWSAPRYTRTDTLLPYPSLFRSACAEQFSRFSARHERRIANDEVGLRPRRRARLDVSVHLHPRRLVWHRLAGDQMRFHRLAIPSRQGCAGRVAIQHALVPFDQRVAVLDGADVAQDRLGRRAVRTVHAEMPLEVADP